MTIDRHTLVAEQLIREHVRKRIKNKLLNEMKQETQLRTVIRQLILEKTETGTDEPSTYTGINVLADLLKSIIPVVGDDYKMLTTSEEQRQSFRNHIIHAVKNTLRPIEVNNAVEDLGENREFEIDHDLLKEAISVDIEDDEEGETVSGEFIDIEEEDSEPEGGFVAIDDQNETGRNFAADTFNKVEKQIVDAYDMLADQEDQELFYDYLLTNLLLYFDKFEDELQNNLPDVSTPEYEKEKEASEEADEAEEDLDADSEEELSLDLDF